MTKPTRAQEQACDQLAEALVRVTEAARLDGRASFNKADLHGFAALLTRASSAFGLDAIVGRALDRRGKVLGLRSGTAELLTLLESDVSPLDSLLLTDAEFLALVEGVERELGEV